MGRCDYGFPKSHAASFAHLVYVSAWMKWVYPDVFACALLNAQPMGFYASAQIARDAREHGVEVRPVDVNDSFWDNTLEALWGRAARVALGLPPSQSSRHGGIRTGDYRLSGPASLTKGPPARLPAASLQRKGVIAAADLLDTKDGARVRLADVIHIIAISLKDQSQALIALMDGHHDLPEDCAVSPTALTPARHPRNARIIPVSRDFH